MLTAGHYSCIVWLKTGLHLVYLLELGCQLINYLHRKGDSLDKYTLPLTTSQDALLFCKYNPGSFIWYCILHFVLFHRTFRLLVLWLFGVNHDCRNWLPCCNQFTNIHTTRQWSHFRLYCVTQIIFRNPCLLIVKNGMLFILIPKLISGRSPCSLFPQQRFSKGSVFLLHEMWLFAYIIKNNR